MAAGTTLGKIGKTEFFAVLPSGVYAIFCLYVVLVLGSLGHSQSIKTKVIETTVVSTTTEVAEVTKTKKSIETNKTIQTIRAPNASESMRGSSLEPTVKNHVDYVSNNPVIILAIIFCSYLLGSIFRAIPVQDVESIFSFGKADKFPYREKLQEQIQVIHSHETISQVNRCHLPDRKMKIDSKKDKDTDQLLLLSLFNYWKDVLCVNSPEGFAFYQEYEARTRFMSSMILAGLFGMFIVLIAEFLKLAIKDHDHVNNLIAYLLLLIFTFITWFICKYLIKEKSKKKWGGNIFLILLVILLLYCINPITSFSQFNTVLFFIFVLSLTIAWAFGINLRQIREQESATLTGLYIAYKQS